MHQHSLILAFCVSIISSEVDESWGKVPDIDLCEIAVHGCEKPTFIRLWIKYHFLLF